MKIWMSGEVQSDVAVGYRAARQVIERAFNSHFELLDFGAGLAKISYLAIIMKEEMSQFGEVKKFHVRDRTAEFRLKVPYSVFVQIDDVERLLVIAKSVWDAVELLNEMKIRQFDYALFRSEFESVWRARGWM